MKTIKGALSKDPSPHRVKQNAKRVANEAYNASQRAQASGGGSVGIGGFEQSQMNQAQPAQRPQQVNYSPIGQPLNFSSSPQYGQQGGGGMDQSQQQMNPMQGQQQGYSPMPNLQFSQLPPQFQQQYQGMQRPSFGGGGSSFNPGGQMGPQPVAQGGQQYWMKQGQQPNVSDMSIQQRNPNYTQGR